MSAVIKHCGYKLTSNKSSEITVKISKYRWDRVLNEKIFFNHLLAPKKHKMVTKNEI